MKFYDFEVFSHDWVVCVYDTTSGWKVIHNNRAELYDFWESSAGDVWVGFNSRHYDRWVFKAILAGFNPKEINDYIIVEGRKGWEFSQTLHKFPLNDYDVKTPIDRGLKTIEGFMGSSIVETSVPFDIDRPLTESELEAVVGYCQTDVRETINIFSYRQDTFKAHLGLINLYGMDIREVSKTGTRLASQILKAEKIRPKLIREEFDLDLPDTLKLDKYQYVADWYLDPKNHKYESGGKRHQLLTDVAGVPHVFGYGGLHGAIEQYSGEGYYVNMDVASLYPSLMVEYDLMSRAVPDPSKFAEIKAQRLEYKKAGDPRSDALKLVLNSTYGALKDKYNPMYDPRQSNRVCVYGQLLLLDLIEKLEAADMKVIQSNTDGVLIKMPKASDFETVDNICHEWETRTRLELEFEEFAKVYQRDVNNYVIVDHGGGHKAKGLWTKKLSDLDYDLPVVNKAVIAYMVSGKPVERTVSETDKLREFQMLVSASSKYQGMQQGNEWLPEKTNRVFASTRSRDKGLRKQHINGSWTKVAGTPERCFIVNSDISEASAGDYPLDKQWYIDLALERLERFGVNG